ncbi:hypothetical protein [Sphaerisporangium aureirubrum]|uniref:DUF4352 domain-containing protein n=1 Tax=Sphaerisporangium aureirubrum TaxID=1544736 RepID=A0ABW1NJS4_9ACTN
MATAVVLVTAGCQFGGEDPGAAVRGGQGTTAGASSVKPVPVSPAPPDRVLAKREAVSGENKLEIAITLLARQERLVTLNFTVSTTTDSTLGWQVGNFFATSPDNDNGSVNGVYLIDPKNAKKHLVAYDSEQHCVCSANLGGQFVKPGGAAVLSATFAAPPPDVAAVDVYIPHAGMFKNVPIS